MIGWPDSYTKGYEAGWKRMEYYRKQDEKRIAELEEERVELQDALDEIATLLSCPPEYDREHLYIDAVAARDIAIKAIDGGPIDEAPGKDGEG